MASKPNTERSHADTNPGVPTGAERRMSLVKLVAIGTGVVTLAGVLLFGWLAWLLSHEPAPLRGNSGWWDWLGHVDGEAIFDAARTTATILAVVGVGGAALVAYRRQDTAERAHQVAIDGQRIANAQHELDSRKYQLDRDRHQLDTDRRKDDREQELRSRFATVAEQLGSANFAVRHAGAYALASLADDWYRFGSEDERQVCVDLLCAQLRRPVLGEEADGPPIGERAQDLEVRRTIIALIRSHRPAPEVESMENRWNSCTLDLSGADLSNVDLERTDLHSTNLDGADLSYTRLIKADLSDAKMSRTKLTRTTFSDTNLTGAKLFGCYTDRGPDNQDWRNSVSMSDSDLSGAWFTNAYLPHADFEESILIAARMINAKLPNANLIRANLTDVRFRGTDLKEADFSNANVRGAHFVGADLTGAIFEDAIYDDSTKWLHGTVPEGAKHADLTKDQQP